MPILAPQHTLSSLSTTYSEAWNQLQRTEKPQNPSNHFRLVQSVRQSNPNGHLRNNYFPAFLELLWSFWAATPSACHFLSLPKAYFSLCRCMEIDWAGMKTAKYSFSNMQSCTEVTRLVQAVAPQHQVNSLASLWEKEPTPDSYNNSSHHQSSRLQISSPDTKQQTTFSKKKLL